MKIVILPAYNEYENLKDLVKNIKEMGYKILLVDDGSVDKTPELKTQVDYYIRHEKNLGLGEALNSAIKFIKNFDDGVAITMDADSSHPADTIPLIEEKLKNHDVVVASRFSGGGTKGVGLTRKILSRIASIILEIRFGLKVKDPTILFRAYRIEVLKKLEPDLPPDFTASFLLLKKLLKITDRICEVPVVVRYDLKKGKSKMRLLKTILAYIKLII